MPNTIPTVTAEQVRAAAAFVDLELDEHDTDQVAALLSQWMPAAESLSTRMQAADLDRLSPITAFVGSDHASRAGGPS